MLIQKLQSISNSVLRKTRKMNFVLGLWMLLELIVFVASLLEDDSIVEAFIISIVFGIIFWLFLFAILLMGGAIKII